jgi:PAS domain S-box-containing protein
MANSGDERPEAEKQVRALCDALQAFAEASKDYPRLVQAVAEQMTVALADGCAVCLLSEDGSTLRVGAVHRRDPVLNAAVRKYVGHEVGVESAALVSKVTRTGVPFVMPTVDAETLNKHFTPEVAALLLRTDARSLLVAPLQVQGVTGGAVVLARYGPSARPFDDEGVAVARTMADGAALAIANSRLLDSCRRELEDRKRAEEQTKRFAALVQHSSDLIAMASLDGEILFINQAGRDLLGIEPGDELSLAKFHTEEGLKRGAMLQATGRWQGEGVLRHPHTGALIPTQISSFLLRDADDKPIGYATVQRDLRQVRSLEHHVRQMQKMDAIGRLAAGVAHDFNNMLAIIVGYGAVVNAGLPEGSALRPEVDEMIAAARRAGELTKQLLAFGRQQVLDPRVVSLNDVVSGIEGMARRLVARDVAFETVLDPAVRPVRVDVGQMEQVLFNLIANARDAMPNGGSLTVTTGMAEIGDSPGADPTVLPGRYVTLQVRDTGIGMDEPTLGRLFEPFFTTKGPGAGTGLGLATAFGVVKQSGGHIAASSRPGQGTTFTIYLPVVLPPDHEPRSPTASPSVHPSSS